MTKDDGEKSKGKPYNVNHSLNAEKELNKGKIPKQRNSNHPVFKEAKILSDTNKWFLGTINAVANGNGHPSMDLGLQTLVSLHT